LHKQECGVAENNKLYKNYHRTFMIEELTR